MFRLMTGSASIDALRSHWSKDFVEHLRTVHFALILVASVLIISGLSNRPSRLPIALTQIQQIAAIQKEWSKVPSALYGQAMRDAKISEEWTIPLRIILPPETHKTTGVTAMMQIPSDIILANQEWKFAGNPVPPVLSLNNFKEFWNALNRGIEVVLIEPPSGEARCSEFVRGVHVDGSTDTITNMDEFLSQHLFNFWSGCTLNADIGTAAVRDPLDFKYEISGRSSASSASVSLDATVYLPTTSDSEYRGKKIKAVVSVSTIDLQTRRAKINETYMRRLFFRDWRPGNFDVAFPELSSVSDEIDTLDIRDAVSRLESQVTSSDRNISLLGLSLPIQQLAQAGFVVLLCVQVYLWLHLHELSSRIEPDAYGWGVAWVGIYKTRTAAAINVISLVILPGLAAITLAYRFNGLHFYYRRTVATVSCGLVLLSIAIGLLTVKRLMALRRNLPANRIMNQPEKHHVASSG